MRGLPILILAGVAASLAPACTSNNDDKPAASTAQPEPGAPACEHYPDSVTATGVEIERGPYLQQVTADRAVIRWRTASESASHVRAGSSPDDYALESYSDAATSEHTVILEGLSAATDYYYAICNGDETVFGGNAGTWFKTAPAPGTPDPTRIWVIGDSGTGDLLAGQVRDAYNAYTGDAHTNLWLMLGDNAYSDGTDREYQSAVFETYPQMLTRTTLWPTLGNHDGHSADSATQSGPYYDIFTLPTGGEAGGVASGTEAYYSFDHANMHFVVLDSYDTDRSADGPMAQWLAADLQATDAQWLIAFWHHPPYTKGSHDSDTEIAHIEMRENLLPILEDYGVDLVLSGHSHNYERSKLIDGHYGYSDEYTDELFAIDTGSGRPGEGGAYEKPGGLPGNEGTVYVVAGCSGIIGDGSLDHPVMYYSVTVLGSLILTVDGATLSAEFLDWDGVVLDTFSVVKVN